MTIVFNRKQTMKVRRKPNGAEMRSLVRDTIPKLSKNLNLPTGFRAFSEDKKVIIVR